MGTQRITLPDEAPLRMILSSCLNHGKPMTAVRVLNVARKSLALQINAATYGLYNQVRVYRSVSYIAYFQDSTKIFNTVNSV